MYIRLVHIKVRNLKIDLTLHGTTYMYTYVFNKLYSVQARSAQFIFHEKIPTQRVVDTFSRATPTIIKILFMAALCHS